MKLERLDFLRQYEDDLGHFGIPGIRILIRKCFMSISFKLECSGRDNHSKKLVYFKKVKHRSYKHDVLSC